MKLGVNDMKARDYKRTERILNICINYANEVKVPYKIQQSYFIQEAVVCTFSWLCQFAC